MVSLVEAKQSALALPEVEEKRHFEKPGFWIKNKIFAVLHEEKACMMVGLSVIDQSVFCAFDKTIIYPVPGGWGRKGATMINLKKIRKAMFRNMLTTAWKTTTPPKLVIKYFPNT